MSGQPPSAAWAPPPSFQFRPRLESADWRRLSAIDVDKVAREVDVLTLQENITNVTFCRLEDEKCPHCRSGVDPVLLKLARLAQLTIEYLMHSQELLTSRLHGLEGRLRQGLGDREQSQELLAKQAGEIKLLTQECKRRKKMISAQQLLIRTKAGYHPCRFCDKVFKMSRASLESHVHGRHSEGSHPEKEAETQVEKLQKEVDRLKEQLQLTRSQPEAAQQAHAVRLSKEHDCLRLFDIWKEDKKEKLVDEMEEVKEMFMKACKELASKSSALEYQLSVLQKSNTQMKASIDTLKGTQEPKEVHRCPQDFQNVMQLLDSQESKWTARVQAVLEECKKEKGQLLSQIEKLQTSVMDDLNASNVLYKKRTEELCQKFQEQNELIITQRQQIKEFASKPFNSVSERKGNPRTWQAFESKSAAPTVPPKASALPAPEVKSNLAKAHERAFSSRVLEPVEELSGRKKGRESEQKSNYKRNLKKALKTKPSNTKEIKRALEQRLVERLETLDIRAGVLGIPSEHLNTAMSAVESRRLERERHVPNIQEIREFLEHQLSCKVEERTLFSCDKYSVSQMDTISTDEVIKDIRLPSKSRRLVRQKPIFADETAVSKIKDNSVDHLPRRSSSTLMPPCSSEEELDEQSFTQVYVCPEFLPAWSSQSNDNGIRKTTVKSGTDWMEGSTTEDSGISPKPTGTCMETLTEKVEEIVSLHRNGNKPASGISATEVLTTKEESQDELQCVDVDSDDWDISSFEGEKSLEQKAGKEPKNLPPAKSELNFKQVKNDWGAL